MHRHGLSAARRPPLASPRPALAVVLLFLSVCCVSGKLNQDCGVTYSAGAPLLFGGVATQCTSGCASRQSDWGKICAFDPSSSVWGVCSKEQAARSFELAKTLGGGSILGLSPCDLVPYLRGRTLWLLGDSHSKSLYRALQCFLFDFWNSSKDSPECQVSANATNNAELLRLPAADGVSNCFHLAGEGGGRVCFVHVVLATSFVGAEGTVADGGVLPLLRARYAQPQDIFQLSVGSWHRKTPEWGAAYAPALETLGQYYQSTRSQWPHLLFREMPAIHPADLPRNTCMPLTGYEYLPSTGDLRIPESANASARWMNGATISALAGAVLTKYGVPVLPAFNLTAPLVDNHVGTRNGGALDCLHYCQPGAPEAWVWVLYNALAKGAAGISPIPQPALASLARAPGAARAGEYVCVPSTIRLRH